MTKQVFDLDSVVVGGAAGEPEGFDPCHLLIPGEVHQPALRQVTELVAKHGGVNLSQGTCHLPTPPEVEDEAAAAIKAGKNRYSFADGVPEFREAVAAELKAENGIPCDLGNVMVTSGSTGAFEAVCSSFLDPGDEVVQFEPGYPYHRSMVEDGHRGVVRMVRMRAPDWDFDPDEFERAITPRTKFVLVTNPGNPTGKVFTRAELEAIAAVCRRRRVLVVTDEVYRHITFDGRPHVSVASLPGMFDHTITMGSFSKTYSITGWRVGYLCAPAGVFRRLRTKSDQKYICAPTPLQWGVLGGMRRLGAEYHAARLAEYTTKRELLCGALEAAGFGVCRPQGAYYVIADTSRRFKGRASEQVAFDELINRVPPGRAVGAVPASDFLGREVWGDPARSTFLRFCFALPDAELEKAAEFLRGLAAAPR